jgi:hypothetical protein
MGMNRQKRIKKRESGGYTIARKNLRAQTRTEKRQSPNPSPQLVLLLRPKPRVSGKISNPNRVTELVVNVHAYFAKASLPAAFHQPLERTANARK